MNQSDWVAFRDPRIRSVAQYKLVDDPDLAGFQTGLRFAQRRAPSRATTPTGCRSGCPAAGLAAHASTARSARPPTAPPGRWRSRPRRAARRRSGRSRRSTCAPLTGPLHDHDAGARRRLPAPLARPAVAPGVDRRRVSRSRRKVRRDACLTVSGPRVSAHGRAAGAGSDRSRPLPDVSTTEFAACRTDSPRCQGRVRSLRAPAAVVSSSPSLRRPRGVLAALAARPRGGPRRAGDGDRDGGRAPPALPFRRAAEVDRGLEGARRRLRAPQVGWYAHRAGRAGCASRATSTPPIPRPPLPLERARPGGRPASSAAGMKPMLTVTGPAPFWATADPRRRQGQYLPLRAAVRPVRHAPSPAATATASTAT